MIGQLDNVQGFIQKWNYPNQQSTLDAEWGTVANCRFLLSSIGSVTPNASLLGADVYNIFVCGRESFAAIEQDGYSAQFIDKNVNFKFSLIDLEARWVTRRKLKQKWFLQRERLSEKTPKGDATV